MPIFLSKNPEGLKKDSHQEKKTKTEAKNKQKELDLDSLKKISGGHAQAG